MLVVTDFKGVTPKDLAKLPSALRSTTTENGIQTLLEENSEGLSMRANQFVFRMNPGLQTTPTFPLGETNTVDLYVRKFGGVEGTEQWKIALATMSPSVAANYTVNTLGTGGTNGIDAIQPSYGSNQAPFQGGPGGTPSTIDLTGDAIVSMSGYTGLYFGLQQIAQLTLKTAQGKTYGPYGTMGNVQNAQPFKLVVPTGTAIRSFFGTTVVHSGGTTYIASLGGNVQPL